MKQRKTKYWLAIKNIEKNYTFFKYFETESEKDKYKRKIKYVPVWRLIEDSTDINWNNSWAGNIQLEVDYLYRPSFDSLLQGVYHRKGVKMKKITITITEKKDSDNVSINLDMKEQKSATKNENAAASNVYMKIEEALKELENLK